MLILVIHSTDNKFNSDCNMKSEHWRETKILNGKFNLITDLTEFRMSLWVVSFGLKDNASGEIILEPVSYFNLDKHEEKGNELAIKFRIYPDGARHYDVNINPLNRTFEYRGEIIELVKFHETFDTNIP